MLLLRNLVYASSIAIALWTNFVVLHDENLAKRYGALACMQRCLLVRPTRGSDQDFCKLRVSGRVKIIEIYILFRCWKIYPLIVIKLAHVTSLRSV